MGSRLRQWIKNLMSREQERSAGQREGRAWSALMRHRAVAEVLEQRILMTSLSSYIVSSNPVMNSLQTDNSALAASGTIAIDWGDGEGDVIHGIPEEVLAHRYSDYATHNVKAYAATSLVIGASNTWEFDAPGKSVLYLDGLDIATDSNGNPLGTLDLMDRDAIIQCASAEEAEETFVTIKAWLESGFNDGTWTGLGITSSTAASDPAGIHGLAVLLVGTTDGFPPPTFFDGIPVNNFAILIKYTYQGDANLDGQVDADDENLYSTGVELQEFLPASYMYGDFDFNGEIDESDLSILTSSSEGQTSVIGTPSGVPYSWVTADPVEAAAAAVIPTITSPESLEFTWAIPPGTTGYEIQEFTGGIWNNVTLSYSTSNGGSVAHVFIPIAKSDEWFRVRLRGPGTEPEWSPYSDPIVPLYSETGAVPVGASILTGNAGIRIKWNFNPRAAGYDVLRRNVGTTTWNTVVTNVSGSLSHWDDTSASASVHEGYEYKVVRHMLNSSQAVGYVTSGIDLPSSRMENRGTVLLLTDDRLTSPLAVELSRLEQDLEGDGWIVLHDSVSETESITDVRSRIIDFNSASPLKSVILIGHIPVPYISFPNGMQSPDGHPNHTTWASDAFYGDLDEGNWNGGYGLWDHDTNQLDLLIDKTIPGNHTVELSVGRIDMFDLPGFEFYLGATPVSLTKQYLDRDHAFRQGLMEVEAAGGVSFDYFESYRNAEASSIGALVGTDNLESFELSQWFGNAGVGGDTILWAGGAGPGTSVSMGGIPPFGQPGQIINSTYFAQPNVHSNAVFNILMGSYFGDWSGSDNLMRSLLANDGSSLTCSWGFVTSGGTPWRYQIMGIGAPIGESIVATQLAALDADVTSNAHVSLLGDPTLRMDIVKPATDVLATRATNGVHLTWTDSIDSEIEGYYVYFRNGSGAFERISGLVTDHFYDDLDGSWGTGEYMVRAVKLEGADPNEYHSGSYFNLSQGAFAGWYLLVDDDVTISESEGILTIDDGNDTVEIPVQSKVPLIIDFGSSDQTITVDQGSNDITMLIECAGTGEVTLVIPGTQTLAALIAQAGITIRLGADATLRDIAGTGTVIIDMSRTLTVTGYLSIASLANDGAVIFDSDDDRYVSCSITGSGAIQKLGVGATTLDDYHGIGDLTISEGTLAFASGIGVIETSALTIGGTPTAGRLDVMHNGLVVHGGMGLGAWDVNGATYNGILALVASGAGISPLGGGLPDWSGFGIITSLAANDLGLGVVSGAYYRNNVGNDADHDLFRGVEFGDSDVIIKFTWNGDSNLDGVIDFWDYAQIDSGFANQYLSPSQWESAGFAMNFANGDFNFDGQIDFWDYAMIDAAFGNWTVPL